MVATLARAGHRRVAVPAANLAEARLVEGVEAIGLEGLDDAARLIAGPRGRTAAAARRRRAVDVSPAGSEGGPPLAGALDPVDLGDIRGQAHARWALEVALAGGHNLLMTGPPGAGKTLIARTIPGLLPPLDDGEALEVAVIESVAGLLARTGRASRRPFRAPHHTSSYAALVGGGPALLPGEATLAHRGVLFLDELAEYDRNVLDALREPLEEGVITIARAHGRVRYPARFQLVAAMNPCRCGHFGSADQRCSCPPGDAERYVSRVSGPFLDRIDLRIEMSRVPPSELLAHGTGEPTAVVRARIVAARRRQQLRNNGRPNAALSGAAIQRACRLDGAASGLMTELAIGGQMSARGVHRVMRVARTIADLADREAVGRDELLAAAALRDPATPRADGAAA